MPLLRGCCSLDLKIGTKIIGVICLIFSIIGFLATAVICIALNIMGPLIQDAIRQSFPPDDGTVRHPKYPQHQDSLNLRSFDDDHDRDEEIDEKTRQMAYYVADHMYIVIVVFLVVLAQQFVEMVVSSLLIHGIRRVRRGLLLPWILVHMLYVIVELGLIVLFITVIVYMSSFYQFILPMIAVDLCWMALHIYFILVVISQYQALGLIRMHEDRSMKELSSNN